jgi:hypothetical protein
MLCDTSEQLSLPDFRRRFSRARHHLQMLAGVVVDISLGTAAMSRMVAITAAVAITVAAQASSAASRSVRWPSQHYRSQSLELRRAHHRRRQVIMGRDMVRLPTGTAPLLRRKAITSSKAITSNMDHRRATVSNTDRPVAITSSMALRRRSRATTSNMGRRLDMVSSTGRPQDTTTETEPRHGRTKHFRYRISQSAAEVVRRPTRL